MGRAQPANALSLGHACSWLTHVLSLPDKEGNAALTLARAARTGWDEKSQTPSDGVGFLFFVLVMGQFRPAHFPSKSRDAQDAAPSFWGASTQSTETFVSQDVGKHRLEGFRFAVFGKDMKCSIHDLSG